MYYVVLGVDWQGSCGIVYRDLETSNVFVTEFKSVWPK
jgi:hypothetical protein